MSNAQTIDVFPVRNERLSAKEFIRLVETNPTLIERSRIVPPELGKKGFGSVEVTYSRPRYRALHALKPSRR